MVQVYSYYTYMMRLFSGKSSVRYENDWCMHCMDKNSQASAVCNYTGSCTQVIYISTIIIIPVFILGQAQQCQGELANLQSEDFYLRNNFCMSQHLRENLRIWGRFHPLTAQPVTSSTAGLYAVAAVTQKASVRYHEQLSSKMSLATQLVTYLLTSHIITQ